MKVTTIALAVVVSMAAAAPARAQVLGGLLKKTLEVKDDLTFTDQQEADLGAAVSAKLRERYGVVQDPAVHKYVTLVGSILAAKSSRPDLPWTFIVLDTDGINAFAAPGGYIHITRGALSILKNEAELADIIGHEITHVTEKHSITAIQKAKVGGTITSTAGGDKAKQYADRFYDYIVEGKWDRGDELKADKNGIALANAAGYAPTGLGDFLTRLDARNKTQPDRNGMFASHPDTQARLDGLIKEIKAQKLTATAMVAARYARSVTFTPVPAPAGSDSPAASGSKFGLGGLSSLSKDKSSNQAVSSGGSRGVNTERDAKGGPNKDAVVVTVTAAEIAEFRKGIAG